MRRQNVEGAFVRPKGILVNWNKPLLVQNAEHCFALSVIPICQYPDSKSIVAKYRAPWKLSKAAFTRGTGNASFSVTSFSRLLSIQ